MAIYIGIFILIWAFGANVYRNKNEDERKKAKKRFCIFVTVVLVLLAALRGSDVGTDTDSYFRDYDTVTRLSYEKIFDRYDNNPGYYALSKFFKDFGASLQVWFGVVALLYVGAVSKLIYRFSSNVGMSYIVFMTLGFYSFSLAGLKQTLAMAFALFAFDFLYDKKYLRFFACILISSFFHVSSLLFIFAFVIDVIKKSRKIYILLTIVFAIVMFNASSILYETVELLKFEHYANYLKNETAYSPTTFLVFSSLLIFALVNFKRYRDNADKEATMFYSLVYFGIITLLFSFEVASAFRLALYFTVFSVVLIPNSISYEKDIGMRKAFEVLFPLVCILYFMYVNREDSSIVPYKFYWEENII